MRRFATAKDLIPDGHCVLGTLLRPFSLGHHLLLLRVGSVFEGDPTAIGTPDELALAVFICAANYQDTLNSLLAGEWESDFQRWQKRLRPRFWQKPRFVHSNELEKFKAYLQSGYASAPVMRHADGVGVSLTSPWECLVKCRLISGGFSDAEVMHMYLPAAWYYYHTLAEIKQIDTCVRVEDFRKVFWTAQDQQKWDAIKLAQEKAGKAAGETATTEKPR